MKISGIKKAVSNITLGGWVTDIPIEGLAGVAFKVRGVRNPDAVRLRAELLSDFPVEQRNTLPPETMNQVVSEILSQAVLLDWNLTGDDDEPIAFSPVAALELLNDPVIGETLRSGVAYASSVVAEHGRATLEVDVKN